jgi:hypothetical protein
MSYMSELDLVINEAIDEASRSGDENGIALCQYEGHLLLILYEDGGDRWHYHFAQLSANDTVRLANGLLNVVIRLPNSDYLVEHDGVVHARSAKQ